MSISYATLSQVSDQSPNPTTGTASDIQRLTEYAIRATGAIDIITKKSFAPTIDTRYYDIGSDAVDAYSLTLDKVMMALTSVTLADDTALVVDTDVRAWPRSDTPKLALRMITTTQTFFDSTGDTLENDVVVVGNWGWHSDYDNAWVLSGDSVQDAAGITASVTTITVTDVDGVSGNGFTPRFSAGNMIRIEDEYLAVISTDTALQTMKVIRGIRGSTAAIHAKDVVIYVFQPDDAIERACQMITAFNYNRRGTYEAVSFDGVRVVNGLEVPQEVTDLLDAYIHVQFGSA